MVPEMVAVCCARPGCDGKDTSNAARIRTRGSNRAVVAATVTATSDVPDTHKGLASGLVTTSQRVAVTVGIPVLGAVMAIRADLLAGIQLALTADVVLTLLAVVIIWAGRTARDLWAREPP